MVALQIRDVPDEVRDVLVDCASRRGQSLQSYLLTLVTEEAGRAANIAMLSRFAARGDGSTLSPGEVSELVDQARAERDHPRSGGSG